VLRWAPPRLAAGAWTGWSLALGAEGPVLRLRLLADEDLDATARDMLATVVRRETGLPLHHVEVERVPRTLLDRPADDETADELGAMGAEVRARETDAALALRVVTPPAPEGRAVRAFERRLEALKTLAQPLGERALFETGDRWLVQWAVRPGHEAAIAVGEPAPER
jgi:hypothetical protein